MSDPFWATNLLPLSFFLLGGFYYQSDHFILNSFFSPEVKGFTTLGTPYTSSSILSSLNCHPAYLSQLYSLLPSFSFWRLGASLQVLHKVTCQCIFTHLSQLPRRLCPKTVVCVYSTFYCLCFNLHWPLLYH